MRFVPKVVVSPTNSSPRMLFEWFDFMRTPSPSGPGWTVPASSDGSTVDTGGLGANITSYADLQQWTSGPTAVSWFVLESPDGLKQICLSRYDTSEQNWYVFYSQSAAFTGGTVDVFPNAVDRATYAYVRIESGGGVLHMGADDEAPYGFWLYEHLAGNFASSRGCIAFIPIVGAPAGDTDPYVMFVANINTGGSYTYGYLYDENNTPGFTRCSGMLNGVGTNCPTLLYYNSGGALAPNQCEVDGDGDDLLFPVPFGLSTRFPNAGFKGVSTFMQWNGRTRAAGETFASGTRVSWGDVNFPWDGSIPEIS